MSSSRRNFRRRAGDTDDDEEIKSTSTTTRTPSSSSTTPKPSTIKPKKSSLLSFADDEDVDDSPFTRPKISTSTSTKPSSSHKLSSSKDRTSSKPSNVQPQAGTYTKEALLELQKNTRTLSGPPKPKSTRSEPIIILKGLIKPISNEPRVKNDENGDDVGEGLGKGVIMDQAAIDAIKAKRERLRERRGLGGDYIALDMGSNHGEAEGLSDEEPEFRGRIGFFGDKGSDGGKKGVFEEFEEREMERGEGGGGGSDDEDEEDKMWEEEQVRKGLGKRIDDAGGSSSSNVVQGQVAGNSVYSSVPAAGASVIAGGGADIWGAGGGLAGLDTLTIGQEAEVAKKALHENLRRLKVSDSVSKFKSAL